MTKYLTELQAYYAMVQLLTNHYKKTKSDDIGSLLSGMQLFDDGSTADPAFWSDWTESIEKALKTPWDSKKTLTELQAFKSMIKFLELYVEFTSSEDTIDLVNQMINPETQKINPSTWSEWMNYTDIALKEPNLIEKLLFRSMYH